MFAKNCQIWLFSLQFWCLVTETTNLKEEGKHLTKRKVKLGLETQNYFFSKKKKKVWLTLTRLKRE